jgi:methionyl-tRNA formyltransferase
MSYNQCLILGTGELAFRCAKLINQTDLVVKIYDTNEAQSKILQQKIQNEKIHYFFKPKKELTEIFDQVQQPTILLSVINPYIIPTKILNNPNIKAINCHPALLPKHPGRNVEAWTIFERDNVAGVTWHTITPVIDSGKILIQKKLFLDDSFTSIKLMKQLNDLAFVAFTQIFEKVINEKEIGFSESRQTRNKIHFSWEKPNAGYLDLSWEGEKISAFLRAMDYGILEFLGKPKLMLDDECFTWKRYKILKDTNRKEEKLEFTNSMIRIIKPDYEFELRDYSTIT